MLLFINFVKTLLALLPPNYYSTLKKAYISLNNLNNTYKIKGKNNALSVQGYLNQVTFDIVGDKNRVFIDNETKINKVYFYIRGSNHRISIGSNCYFNRGSYIYFEDSDCRFVIGDNTSI